MDPRPLLGACGVVAAAALVTSLAWQPLPVGAFTLAGHSLDLGQRDFRVFNNFADAAANDNTIEHPAFPGSTGAPLALRKAHAEWGSRPWQGHGLGDGLASNPVLGSGGANFDQHFQGLAPSVGAPGENIHSALNGGPCGGGVLAFVQASPSGAGGGWTITYCDGWVWSDGPGLPGAGQLDLQAVATRQIGFALGLGTSTVAGSTMHGVINGDGTSARSLHADDIAGLQAIYGVAALSKPRITAVIGSDTPGGTLQIHGSGFHPTSNEVWLPSPGTSGDPVVAAGVGSLGGGTVLTLTVPAGVGVGDLLVRVPGTGGASLSNAWPFEAASPPGRIQLTGPGLGGASGEVPQLTASGDLTPGSGPGFEAHVVLGAPSTPGVLFVGAGEGNLPFKGGVFDPVPVVAEFPFVTTAAGELYLASAVPAGPFSGINVFTQAWMADPSGPLGATATNGLLLLIP